VWSNLLLTCSDCNVHKGPRFPLADETKRATGPAHVTAESPLFLDPYADAPNDHIAFRDEVPRGLTERGRETLSGCASIGLR
jgi:hypothetical protein